MRRATVVCGLLLFAAVSAFLVFGPGYKWKTNSFFRQMQQVTDPGQLQKWATDEIDRADGSRTELDGPPSFLFAPDDGPPARVRVEPGQENQSHVIVSWGGGFGHWGLVIGSPSLRFSDEASYHIEWAPGVYVWHEVQ